jgi:hypothetical protein
MRPGGEIPLEEIEVDTDERTPSVALVFELVADLARLRITVIVDEDDTVGPE